MAGVNGDAAIVSQSSHFWSPTKAAFLKSPERVAKIVKDIADHFKEKVEPHGYKALIVTPDRYACVQYKEELDNYFPTEASAVVISTSANDDFEFKQKWGLDKSQQEKVVDDFNDTNSALKFIIVTAKLLTGFDAPILQTLYLDKSIKDHTLLQAICRTNRLYPGKSFGRIVDYFGVFDDAAKALCGYLRCTCPARKRPRACHEGDFFRRHSSKPESDDGGGGERPGSRWVSYQSVQPVRRF